MHNNRTSHSFPRETVILWNGAYHKPLTCEDAPCLAPSHWSLKLSILNILCLWHKSEDIKLNSLAIFQWCQFLWHFSITCRYYVVIPRTCIQQRFLSEGLTQLQIPSFVSLTPYIECFVAIYYTVVIRFKMSS